MKSRPNKSRCRSRTALAIMWVAGALGVLPGHAEPEPARVDLAVDAGEWPRWRGRGFDGTARAKGTFADPFELAVRWRRDLGSGYSGVVVAAGHAVTMFSDGEVDFVVALDAESGAERWRVAVGATFPGREGATDGPVSTPAIDGGVVFALGPRGDLLAIDLKSGQPIWRAQLAEQFASALPHWGFTTSPLVAGERLIVQAGGTEGRAVVAFDRRSGEAVWHAGDEEVEYQSPILTRVAGEEQLIVVGSLSISGLDPATGSELWSHLHEGDRFYRKIVNPVRVGTDGLLLTHRSQESKLIRWLEGGQRTRIEEAWTTPYLKRNYATPVAQDGYIYGYSGGFLSCVDAQSGELAWKSRPPGNGWPILVDDHLVVLTKRGTLHVAPATPREFRETAKLEVFDRLVWTPPAFAYGRIYARDSYRQVACVDVIATSSQDLPSGATPAVATRGKMPQSEFGRWIEELEGAPDKAQRIRQWLAKHQTIPVIEGDRWAHFVYAGDAEELVLRASPMELGDVLAMHRVAGTDFHYASLELEPDARINYLFYRDLDEALPDPANPMRSASIVFGGEVSQLLMPRAERSPSLDPEAEPRGNVETFELETPKVRIGAKTWGGSRKVHVYLPPGYADGDRRYPTLYFLYGGAVLRQAEMDRRLDALIGARIEPLIAVFVESISAYEYARSQRGAHGRMIVEQLIPRIDERYRTLADANHRTVAGVDEAGYAALEIGFHYPRVVGRISAQSVSPIGKGDVELLQAIAEAQEMPSAVYLDWGRYDLRDPSDGTDIPAYGGRLRKVLESRGIKVTGRQWNDGSDVLFWSWRLERMLEGFFPLNQR